MRNCFIMFIAMTAMCLFMTTEANAQRHDFANYQRYAKENADLGLPKKGEKRVVFMGNSITEGYGIWADKKYPDHLQGCCYPRRY